MWPSDFHPFGSLKKHLDDKRFAAEADVKQAVTSCRRSINAVLVHEEENLDVIEENLDVIEENLDVIVDK